MQPYPFPIPELVASVLPGLEGRLAESASWGEWWTTMEFDPRVPLCVSFLAEWEAQTRAVLHQDDEFIASLDEPFRQCLEIFVARMDKSLTGLRGMILESHFTMPFDPAVHRMVDEGEASIEWALTEEEKSLALRISRPIIPELRGMKRLRAFRRDDDLPMQ